MKNLVFGKTQKKEEKDFHSKRTAFLIINNEILFLQNSTMSHWEWYSSLNKNATKEEFNKITRGYCLNGRAIFYKGNFDYDEECVNLAKQFALKIKEFCALNELEIWCGVEVKEPGTEWPPKFFVEKI